MPRWGENNKIKIKMEMYCIMNIARDTPTLFPATHKTKKKKKKKKKKNKLVAVKSINP
jgi:hypothetical protein